MTPLVQLDDVGFAYDARPVLRRISFAVEPGDFVKVESRRGNLIVPARVVTTIRPDTVFVPYHWPLDRAANRATIRAIDPVSNIPEYKICAVRVSKVARPDDAIAHLPPQAGGLL